MKKAFALLIVIIIATLTSCTDSGTGGSNNNNNGDSENVMIGMQQLASGVMLTYNIHDNLDFTPDGNSGIYFMETRQSTSQKIYHYTASGIEYTGLKPTGFVSSANVPTFMDIHCDSSGLLYVLLEYNSVHYRHTIYWVDFDVERAYVFKDAASIANLYSEAGLNPYHSLGINSQMVVTPEGKIWMLSIDPEYNNYAAAIYLFNTPDDVTVFPLQRNFFDFYGTYRLGLANDGDLLITEVSSYYDSLSGLVWRCDPVNGLYPYISLMGFPTTVSSFAETDDGLFIFATNFVLNISDNIILRSDGNDLVQEVSVDWFTYGVNWIFCTSGEASNWKLYSWNSDTLVDYFGSEYSPEFWNFWLDPNDGSIITFDQTWGNGDFYRITLTKDQ